MNAGKRSAALFVLCSLTCLGGQDRSFFVDPVDGDDARSGLGRNESWKSFAPVNALDLSPGDRVEIVGSGSFSGTLMPKARGTESEPVVIRFAKGTYDIFPSGLERRKYHISNTNAVPEQPKAIAILLEKCRHVRVVGDDALLKMRGKMIEVCLENSRNISLEGLRFDYHRPTVSELRVREADRESAILDVHEDSAYEIRDGILHWIGEGWEARAENYGQVLDPASGHVRRMKFPLSGCRVSEIEPGRIRAFFPAGRNPGFVKGHVYQHRDPLRDCVGVFQVLSRDIAWSDCTFHFIHGMGIVSQFSENLSFVNVDVVPSPGSGRTCAAFADVFHFSGCRGDILLENCRASGTNDDMVNVHGTHLRIMDTRDDSLRLKFMHRETYGFPAFYEGDTIDFINAKTLLPYASRVVRQVERINDKEMRVNFGGGALPGECRKGDAIENATWTPDVHIKGCTAERIPTRGFLLTTRGRILVEGNLFKRTHMPAILVADDAGSWYESGFVRDLTIRGNRFVDCGEPVISIDPENRVHAGPVHENIRVLDNEFVLRKGMCLHARSSARIVFEGNRAYLRDQQADTTSFIDCTELRISEPARHPR